MLASLRPMTRVLQHDYGKSKVSLLQIRSAIKAVREEKSVAGNTPAKSRKASAPKPTRQPAGSSKRK